MRFDLDEQQRDFAASIDAVLSAADLPAAVRAWAAGDPAPGRKVWAQLADLGVTALTVSEKYDGIGAHHIDSWSPRSGWAAGVCPARSPNQWRWHRFCSPTTTDRPHWRPAS
jgi:alkylation response protein AidB-like acyl-CoA dehydrogenase